MKTTLSVLAILAIASPALAEGCNWGHQMSAETVAQSTTQEAEMPALAPIEEGVVVASVDCSALTGAAAQACLTAAK